MIEKKAKQTIMLAKVPITFGADSVACFAPFDLRDEQLIVDREILEAQIDLDRRSNEQNALWAVWYGQIARFFNYQNTIGQVKCYCKLHYAVPLLQAENAYFRNLYQKLIRDRYIYEEKIELMKILPVTSLFSKSQGQKYQTTLQQEFAVKGLNLEVL